MRAASVPAVLLAIHDLCRAHASSHLWYVLHDAPSGRLSCSNASADYSLFYYFLLWFSLAAVALLFIFIHGIDYVNWPRLQPLTDIIYYDGPGFRSARKGMGIGLPALQKITEGAALGLAEQQHRRAKSKRLEEIEMGTKERVD